MVSDFRLTLWCLSWSKFSIPPPCNQDKKVGGGNVNSNKIVSLKYSPKKMRERSKFEDVHVKS